MQVTTRRDAAQQWTRAGQAAPRAILTIVDDLDERAQIASLITSNLIIDVKTGPRYK